MNVVLTGFMGTGKTEIGKLLANELDVPFADTDAIVENKAGMTISEVFERYGEPGFRDLERGVVEEVVSSGAKSMVLATGGGTVLDEVNRQALLGWGKLVCLTASIESILDRVAKAGHRPLLNEGGVEEAIKRLMEQRRAAYSDCDLEVDTTHKSPDEVVAEVRAALGL